MSFHPIRGGRGQPRVKCTCADCGREEVVAAIHGRDGKEGEGQAVQKITAMGWTYLSKRLRCPACDQKRRTAKATASDKAAPPAREPTREDKRRIMDLLTDVYDTDAECYRQGDTDDTVAEVLEVMPAWVADLREEFFGPVGSNQDLADLRRDIVEQAEQITDLKAELDLKVMDVQNAQQSIRAMLGRLDKIESALSPRVRARAGV
jgi:hypothetical protein